MANVLEIVFVLDRSGSMGGKENDIIGGFNTMIREQREKGQEALVSTVLFSDTSQVLYDRVKLEDVAPMTSLNYLVYGCTALLDAVGDAIRHIANVHKYAREEDVPTKTLFVVMTDGEENSSRRYTNKQIKEMVQRQQKDARWEFIFVGADIDAFASARSLGIREERAVRISKDEDCLDECFRAVGSVMDCMINAEAEEEISDMEFRRSFRLFKKR